LHRLNIIYANLAIVSILLYKILPKGGFMEKRKIIEATILGITICVGLALLGFLVSRSAISINRVERTVIVKGLSEREVPANIAIWPITFNDAGNNLEELYSSVEAKTKTIVNFLKTNGLKSDEISVSTPSIEDRFAQTYVETEKVEFRYVGRSTITVYTQNIDMLSKAMNKIVDLGKSGIAIAGQDYNNRTEYLYTKLNDIKPDMIEEATKNAREVAEKFAKDSESKLGKIKKARQGQFSISNRDSNTPYIKKVRVVSTVEYYLSD